MVFGNIQFSYAPLPRLAVEVGVGGEGFVANVSKHLVFCFLFFLETSYPDTFIFLGKSIVDWLLRWSLVRSRSNGAAMGQALKKLGHIQEVDLKDGTMGAAPKFSDTDKLYRFVSGPLHTWMDHFNHE